MALRDFTLSNDDWWRTADALRAAIPPDAALANVIEAAIPARGTNPTTLKTIVGLTDVSQASLIARLPFTPPPIFGCKGIHSTLIRQGAGT